MRLNNYRAYFVVVVGWIRWNVGEGLEDRRNKQDNHNCRGDETPRDYPVVADCFSGHEFQISAETMESVHVHNSEDFKKRHTLNKYT